MKKSLLWIYAMMLYVAIFGSSCNNQVGIGFGVIPTQSYYGQVVDQSGQPISGVTVTGTLAKAAPGVSVQFAMMGTSDGASGGGSSDGIIKEQFFTESDSNGFFQFTGMRGFSFSVRLSKDGFETENPQDTQAKSLASSQSTSTNRIILTMRKIPSQG